MPIVLCERPLVLILDGSENCPDEEHLKGLLEFAAREAHEEDIAAFSV